MILIAERSCACLDNSCFVSDEWWNTGDCKWTSFYIALFLLYLSTWSTLHNMPHSSINARNFCLCFLPLFPFFCVFYLAFTTILTCFIQSTLSAKSECSFTLFLGLLYLIFSLSFHSGLSQRVGLATQYLAGASFCNATPDQLSNSQTKLLHWGVVSQVLLTRAGSSSSEKPQTT